MRLLRRRVIVCQQWVELVTAYLDGLRAQVVAASPAAAFASAAAVQSSGRAAAA